MNKYIEAKTFEDFCSNQRQLIDVLNHRTDKLTNLLVELKTDVNWTKKILWAIFSVTILAVIINFMKAIII
jgi:hypothetical protein